MGNSLLTIDMITRKSLEIFENNLVLTRNINRQYDDSFAVEGAKIGSTLRIRLPDRALVTDGAALQVQDDNEQYTTLAVASQKHIGVNFTSAELTMQLDDFAERVLKPRISQLASSIDADVANVYKSVYNSVGTPGTTPAPRSSCCKASRSSTRPPRRCAALRDGQPRRQRRPGRRHEGSVQPDRHHLPRSSRTA